MSRVSVVYWAVYGQILVILNAEQMDSSVVSGEN